MRFIQEPLTDLTYSDVFLTPSGSEVISRFDVSLASDDGTGTTIPLVAANMTAVTGRRMVETMARRGGLAILPQDIPLNVIQEVTEWVKGRSPVFDSPVRLKPENTAIDALHLIDKRAHEAIVVVDDQDHPVGIVSRDQLENVDRFTSLASLMRTDFVTVNAAEIIEAGAQTSSSAAHPSAKLSPESLARMYELAERSSQNLLPVLAADGRLAGVLTPKAIVRSSLYESALDSNGKLKVGAAVGINGDVAAKAQALLDFGVDVLVVDTAHGHQQKMVDALHAISALDPQVPIVAGNVVSGEGVRDLVKAGANIVKVGVGPGAMCTTRMMTAVGRPQFSAVLESARVAKDLGASVWADGGVRYPRDVALALAAGASQVMIGSWFAGTYESPGDLKFDGDGRAYKESFGMASARAVQNRTRDESAFTKARKALFEEGISSSRMYIDPANPSVEDLLDMITTGVRSSMSYAGARNLAEFRDQAIVGIQSAAGYEEGRPLPSSW